ncbi:serine hydrolase domain-containing protein [Arenibacter sp. M-2]|uniref:serine hydrolase domain-containing protein n=1 Tax=Arenibacter sp. M-2 TaxID=3053612 RepID=UPI002570AFB7|nr:serine hydrolase domain-containing protein [Arenibacter sp. M-2]MDL5513541.1 serine hydrolase domain-containing protein [Arenibacter sp. M-2]
MKKAILVLAFLHLACTEHDEVFQQEYYHCKNTLSTNNPNHQKAIPVKRITEEMVSKGVPGVMMSVHTEIDGYYSTAYGKNDLSNQIDIQACNLTRVGSTVKTFTAVTLLKLQEEGKLDLDDLLSKYLPQSIWENIENAKEVSLRQLLNHSSGIYNYIQDVRFQTASLNDLIKVWTPEELLDYAGNNNANFETGTDVAYSNTNYILLGMVIESLEGKPFYKVFEDKIFKPLELEMTQFAASDPVPVGIVRGYIDLYGKLELTNATYYSGWDYFSADGGLISNAHDLNIFLTNLFHGNILSNASLQEMMDWQSPKEQNNEDYVTQYGLGIFLIETDYGPAYLHSGDAIGYFASMVYFPNQKTTISWAVNANYGKIDDITQSRNAMNKIFKAVLEEPQ